MNNQDQNLPHYPACNSEHTYQDGLIVVKVGTKVRNIHLAEGDHDIDCRIEGVGPMKLKSQFVKKI